jgi:hypothetical protein
MCAISGTGGGATAAWSFSTRQNFASCRQAKEIVGFGYSDSVVASDLKIFAAERASDAKLVAELEAKREAAINAYMASMLAWPEITPRPSGSTT